VRRWLRRMMATEKVTEPTDPNPTYTLRDHYLLECHRIMAEHLAIEPRGWETQRQRQQLHRQWDDAYDRFKRCGG
jgi:hypothetical protein